MACVLMFIRPKVLQELTPHCRHIASEITYRCTRLTSSISPLLLQQNGWRLQLSRLEQKHHQVPRPSSCATLYIVVGPLWNNTSAAKSILWCIRGGSPNCTSTSTRAWRSNRVSHHHIPSPSLTAERYFKSVHALLLQTPVQRTCTLMQPEVESRAIAASYRSLCLYERYIRAKESCPFLQDLDWQVPTFI